MNSPSSTAASDSSVALPTLALRGIFGGILMGLANLVPGISGGTMLVAAGIYPRFIEGMAEVSTLRFRMPSLVVLGSVAAAAALSILLLAGVVKDLVIDHRWIMYSLFIGLTLGGLPVVWRMARPVCSAVWAGSVVGFLVMLMLVVFKETGGGVGESNPFLLGLGGLAGASAMILPGVSGGYLLLLLGQYLPILSGIEAFKEGLASRDVDVLLEATLGVGLPVGLGVGIGLVVVSNLLRWLLHHHRKLTLGILIGLLLGSVLGLWPFQESVSPVPGETTIKGQLVTAENLADFDPEDYPTAYFSPAPSRALLSLLLVTLGFGVTSAIARVGRETE